jgi:hypothetical protein
MLLKINAIVLNSETFSSNCIWWACIELDITLVVEVGIVVFKTLDPEAITFLTSIKIVFPLSILTTDSMPSLWPCFLLSWVLPKLCSAYLFIQEWTQKCSEFHTLDIENWLWIFLFKPCSFLCLLKWNLVLFHRVDQHLNSIVINVICHFGI